MINTPSAGRYLCGAPGKSSKRKWLLPVTSGCFLRSNPDATVDDMTGSLDYSNSYIRKISHGSRRTTSSKESAPTRQGTGR